MAMSDYAKKVRAALGKDIMLMPSVTGLVADESGRFLLMKHADTRRWVLPGGSVEPLEIPADAVVREVWEETGLEVAPIRLAGIYGGEDFLITYSNGDRTSYIMLVFECRVCGGKLRPDPEETLDLGYFDFGGMAGLNVAPWVATVVGDAVTRESQAAFQEPVWNPAKQAVISK